MNWKEIKKKYPKAYAKFIEWVDAETLDILKFELMMILKNERDLFDFFDEQKIYVMILRDHLFVDSWFGGIEKGESEGGFKKIKHCKNRSETETAAFEYAFKMLENKL